MEPKLGPLRQIAFSCKDLQRSMAYYREQLGLELIAEFTPPGIAFFWLDGTRLMLEQHAEGGGHNSVLYFTVDDIDAAQQELERRGVRFNGKPHLIHRDDAGTFGPQGGEEWMTFFEDLDGNLLSLVEHRVRSKTT